jgi:hypothetical protein
MVAVMHRLEPLRIHVGINLGGGDIGVAQQLLDDPQVRAVAQQMCGKGMPQQMRVDVHIHPRVQGDPFQDLPDADGG